ncbi:integration host factor subunit alpha [Nicoletella semolina]|uniref:Integration host factor subunit alpha n=1 Tax=Nicoletella semolina TaxID=271160 RepID=A0A4V2SK43_9PAST|nr:integration host factor subunit alpha [Nicoletella semolina]MDH2923925.1 integration host factor subunit alpha [Nicoletella semolina]TCP18046.1 integration host factor subunit alpha [Nicoletella semolina]
MTLTKMDIVENLVDKCGLEQQTAKCFVEQFFEEIRVALEQGDYVKLSGFGNFLLREKQPRPGRNPRTGEDVIISARRIVSFRPGQKLRERVGQAKVKT